jgi:hypothetical protein
MSAQRTAPVEHFAASADSHFRLYFYSVVARLLAHVAAEHDRLAGLRSAFSFLDAYQALLARYVDGDWSPAQHIGWWDDQIAQLEARCAEHLPLRALRLDAALSEIEIRLLLAVGMVEEDVRFGALFAALQEPLLARRPCIGLLGWCLALPDEPPLDLWAAAQRLIDAGLLLAENRADSRAEWLLRIPPAIWDGMTGRSQRKPLRGVIWQQPHEFPPLDQLILPDALLRQVAHLPALIEAGQLSALVLRGMSGSGRRTTLGAVARAHGRGLLLCTRLEDDNRALIGGLSSLLGALPVVRCNPPPGETLDMAALAGYGGCVGLTLGQAGGLRGDLMDSALTLHLPPPDAEARARFWALSGVPLAQGEHATVVDQFLLTGGHIQRVAASALAYAQLDGRHAVGAGDVRLAARSLNRQALETLATPLETVEGWSSLVLDELTSADLLALEARCRERERLLGDVGSAFAHTLNRGVRALFTGPSGTGKTLGARALAGALRKDLYRIDLAAVVNKYIGETERNLNEVFSRAEELDVVLLLDEGDSLMTQRTDVRSSNDRYANLETNYLLQRLESYEGIVIVTTNAGQRIDQAFMRRIDAVVDFVPPGPAERLRLWRAHLPQHHVVSPEFLDEVAARCGLTGGQIRNAALHAVLLALGSGQRVDDGHLEDALLREYRKAGASYPLRAADGHGDQAERLRRFSASLR